MAHVAKDLGVYLLTDEFDWAGKTTPVRYERARPSELVHMYVKKVGRIHDGGGWKAHGQTGAQKRARIGFAYAHFLVDDHPRLAYSAILSDEGATCAGFLLRAAGYFHPSHLANRMGLRLHLPHQRRTGTRLDFYNNQRRHTVLGGFPQSADRRQPRPTTASRAPFLTSWSPSC
ncbi:hypothetical protein EV647_0598 [Kribbella sp. VKM Ac-2566]|nr:hypothetical protein EV647_0598 [Kribbella sp. VKM Ac-2566]